VASTEFFSWDARPTPAVMGHLPTDPHPLPDRGAHLARPAVLGGQADEHNQARPDAGRAHVAADERNSMTTTSYDESTRAALADAHASAMARAHHPDAGPPDPDAAVLAEIEVLRQTAPAVGVAVSLFGTATAVPVAVDSVSLEPTSEPLTDLAAIHVVGQSRSRLHHDPRGNSDSSFRTPRGTCPAFSLHAFSTPRETRSLGGRTRVIRVWTSSPRCWKHNQLHDVVGSPSG